MKINFRDDWFKLGILSAIFITVLFIGYYFVLYLPMKDKEYSLRDTVKNDVANQKECAESGQKYFDKNLAYTKDGGDKISLDGPYFHFNKKLQSCLLEYKFIMYPNSYDTRNFTSANYIINLTSGGNLAFSTDIIKNGVFISSWNQKESERFDIREQELMNE